VQIEALERFEARDDGQVQVSGPRHRLLNEPDPVPKSMPGQRQPAAGGMTLASALAAFHKERTAGGGTLAAKTMEEHRNAVRMFNEFLGAETSLKSITKKHVIEYKQALFETPNR
jgi:hypothetical protein